MWKNIWKSERKTAAVTSRPQSVVMIETLESRELLSAAPHPAAVVKAAPTIEAAIVVAAKPAVKPVAKPAVKVVAKAASKVTTKTVAATVATSPVSGTISVVHPVPATNIPNLVGTWTGTMLVDGATTTTPFSIDFKFQLEGNASGAFHLGPLFGNQTVDSTFILTTHNNARALILTNTIWAGFTGALIGSNTLDGRFAVNLNNTWTTGTFSLTRN